MQIQSYNLTSADRVLDYAKKWDEGFRVEDWSLGELFERAATASRPWPKGYLQQPGFRRSPLVPLAYARTLAQAAASEVWARDLLGRLKRFHVERPEDRIRITGIGAGEEFFPVELQETDAPAPVAARSALEPVLEVVARSLEPRWFRVTADESRFAVAVVSATRAVEAPTVRGDLTWGGVIAIVQRFDRAATLGLVSYLERLACTNGLVRPEVKDAMVLPAAELPLAAAELKPRVERIIASSEAMLASYRGLFDLPVAEPREAAARVMRQWGLQAPPSRLSRALASSAPLGANAATVLNVLTFLSTHAGHRRRIPSLPGSRGATGRAGRVNELAFSLIHASDRDARHCPVCRSVLGG